MFVPQKRMGAVAATVLASLIICCGSSFADEVVLPMEVPPATTPDQSALMALPPANAPDLFAPSPIPDSDPPVPDQPMTLPPVESEPPAPVDTNGRIFSSGPIDEPVPSSRTSPGMNTSEAGIPLPLPVDEPTAMHVEATDVRYLNKPMHQQQSCQTCWHQSYSQRWFSFESLLWWTSGAGMTVVATTSPRGTPTNEAGILLPRLNTQTLFGGSDIYDFPQGGFRLRGGRWLDNCDGTGFSAEFLMLAPRGTQFSAQSNGNPIIARPFMNAAAAPAFADSELLAYPGLSNGTFSFTSDTNMYSVGVHFMQELFEDCCCNGCRKRGGSSCGQSCGQSIGRLGFKIGPRFAHLNDTVTTGVASGNQLRLVDRFSTENSFLGGELGLRARRGRGHFSLDLGVQLAVGMTRQELDIAGHNTTTSGAGTMTSLGGFYAQSSNIGSYEHTRFSVVPALEVALGWELKRGWRFTAGYNFMFWSNVVRAAEQIDPVINEDFFAPPVIPTTGANRPDVLFHETDYFAHGISIGFEKRW